jgi:tRNA A-37 threonylcarbamoyl transferase component Bud32
VKILGQGGMGAVYLAEDQRLPTQWAIKEMKREGLTPQELQDAADLFRTEARLLSDLRHRNLPRIVDFFQQDVQLYLVMDFIDGETLEAKIARDGPISLPFALDLCLQISDVLDYLHTRKEPVVFRDFKPGNVMLTPQNEVKLVDFGIARIFRKGQSSDTKALGTPGYAAPEQYGKGQSGPRTDLYAFGATIHHALSGRDPTAEPFVFPPLSDFRGDLPPELIALLDACLSMQPDGRPESAFAVKRQLEQIMGITGSSSLAGRPTTTRLGDPAGQLAPGTLPLAPAAAPPAAAAASTQPGPAAGHSLTFMPNVLVFKDLALGHKASARVRVKTARPVTLTSNSAHLKVDPVQVPAGTSTVIVSLDSQGLEGGSLYKSAVEVQELEEADLPVEAHLSRPRASTGVLLAAIALTVCSLIPVLSYLCTATLAVLCLSTPKPQRLSLRVPWRLSLLLSIAYTAFFAAIAFGLVQAYGVPNLEGLRFW